MALMVATGKCPDTATSCPVAATTEGGVADQQPDLGPDKERRLGRGLRRTLVVWVQPPARRSGRTGGRRSGGCAQRLLHVIDRHIGAIPHVDMDAHSGNTPTRCCATLSVVILSWATAVYDVAERCLAQIRRSVATSTDGKTAHSSPPVPQRQFTEPVLLEAEFARKLCGREFGQDFLAEKAHLLAQAR